MKSNFVIVVVHVRFYARQPLIKFFGKGVVTVVIGGKIERFGICEFIVSVFFPVLQRQPFYFGAFKRRNAYRSLFADDGQFSSEMAARFDSRSSDNAYAFIVVK